MATATIVDVHALAQELMDRVTTDGVFRDKLLAANSKEARHSILEGAGFGTVRREHLLALLPDFSQVGAIDDEELELVASAWTIDADASTTTTTSVTAAVAAAF